MLVLKANTRNPAVPGEDQSPNPSKEGLIPKCRGTAKEVPASEIKVLRKPLKE